MRSPIYCVVALLAVLSISVINGQADIPTLLPSANFDPVADAQKLNDAMAGFGTDEQAIIEVLCYRAASQRATITETYNRQFGGNLVTDLIGELTGSFQAIAVTLTYSMSEMLAIELYESLTQAGTDEDSLVEVLLSRSNNELNVISNDFLTKYGYSLVTGIQLDTTGSLQDFLVGMAEGKRDESTTVDPALVQSDVTRLYDAGVGQAGTNEAEFVTILGQRSYPHINSVSEEYANIYNSTLEEDVQLEFIGDIRKALLDTLLYAGSKATYFATRFKDSTFGAGTKDRNLDRQHISRCEIDLGNIKDQYQDQYGVPLASDVAGDTAGSHQAALLALLG